LVSAGLGLGLAVPGLVAGPELVGLEVVSGLGLIVGLGPARLELVAGFGQPGALALGLVLVLGLAVRSVPGLMLAVGLALGPGVVVALAVGLWLTAGLVLAAGLTLAGGVPAGVASVGVCGAQVCDPGWPELPVLGAVPVTVPLVGDEGLPALEDEGLPALEDEGLPALGDEGLPALGDEGLPSPAGKGLPWPFTPGPPVPAGPPRCGEPVSAPVSDEASRSTGPPAKAPAATTNAAMTRAAARRRSTRRGRRGVPGRSRRRSPPGPSALCSAADRLSRPPSARPDTLEQAAISQATGR
jgi:hypothetical protein